MQAQEIIEKIRAETSDPAQIKATLEDGAALAALGITDVDQGEVEEAHFLVSQEIKNQ